MLESIAGQGKLTDELFRRIVGTLSRTELEDLYLPFKPKRRTRAMIARERGLEPLADLLWAAEGNAGRARASSVAQAFVSTEKGVADVEAAWAGARDIVAERISGRRRRPGRPAHADRRRGVLALAAGRARATSRSA